MSKRIISFLLCALLALSAAGCGKDKPVSGNKKPGNTSSVGSDISSSEPDNTEETDSTDSKPDNSAVKTNTEIGDPLPDVSDVTALLAQAKALHDELEAVYNPHVDFARVYALANAHALRLFKEN